MIRVSQYISKEEAKAVSDAVHEAELTTSGEIVPVVINRSDAYAAASWRVAVVIMLAAAAVCAFAFPMLSLIELVVIQIPVLIAGLWIGSLPAVQRLAIHPDEMRLEVRQRAMQAFFIRNLHTTRDRTGILIFVSLLEHRVEVLGDSGINAKVKQEDWQGLVDIVVKGIRNQRLADGLVDALKQCSKIVTPHFPIRPDNTNELKNDLIMIDE